MKKITNVFMFLMVSFSVNAYSEAPNLLTYQGRLKEGGQAVTGNRTVEIFLCNAESGPTCHSSGAQSVAVSNGLFRSTFTIPAAANFGAGNWWLEIKVGLDTLAPREQFTSNAYAMFAATAAYASNITAAEGSSGVTISSNLYVSGGFAVGASTLVVINGNVGVNTADPTYPLHIQAASGAEDTLYLKDSGQNVSLVMMSQVNYDAKIEVPNTGAGLTMEIGSTPSVHISSAYNTGFGTLNPAARVHISSAAGEAGNMLIISTGTSNVIRLTGAGEVYANKYYGDGSVLTGITASGDDLGNHNATQNLQLNWNNIYTVSTMTAAGHISAAAYQVNGTTVLAVPGTFNVFVGKEAGSIATGQFNTLVGHGAGNVTTTPDGNTFIGSNAGLYNTTGSDNAVVGRSALHDSRIGSGNAVLGALAGFSGANYTVSSAALMGYMAGYNLQTSYGNVLLGFQAGDSLNTGSRNIIIGYDQDATAPTISDELNIGGLLRGNLNAGSIGIGFTNTIPLAALDVKSTGTALTEFAQIWRDGSGNVISSVSATGVMMASKYIGDGSALSGITASSYSGTLPVANGGTGATTLTGMIKGNGTGAVTAMTGTANRATRWSDNNTIAASALITDNGTNVGIGAALPDQELTVAGDISQTGVIISSGVGNNYFAGNVGIGISPLYKLHVAGSINASSSLCIADNCKASWPVEAGSQVLQMGSYGVNTSSHISAAAYQVNGSTALAAFSSLEGVSVGLNTGPQNSGTANTFIGHNTGLLNTVGAGNTFVGRGAGATNSSGGQNTFIGKDAGITNMTGSANAVLGYEAASVSALFSSSTIVGYRAGYNLDFNANDNILIGFQAGDNLDTGSRNIIIGYDQDATASTISNELNIGGLLRGNLSAGTIGIGFNNTIPLAALDVRSTGTGPDILAQVWRNDGGAVISSMTSTGLLVVSSISASGRVGAGTITPRSALDVWGGSLYLGQTGAVHGYINADDALYINIDANNDDPNNLTFLQIGHNSTAGGSPLLYVGEAGIVGIGTNAPMAALDVKSTGTLVSQYAQIWRNSGDAIISSMTSTGLLAVSSVTVSGRLNTVSLQFGSDLHISKFTAGSVTVDPANIIAANCINEGVAVASAQAGDHVIWTAPSGINPGLVWSGYDASSAGTLGLRICNVSGGAIDPVAATWRYTIIR